jgi:hypothetical protein
MNSGSGICDFWVRLLVLLRVEGQRERERALQNHARALVRCGIRSRFYPAFRFGSLYGEAGKGLVSGASIRSTDLDTPIETPVSTSETKFPPVSPPVPRQS